MFLDGTYFAGELSVAQYGIQSVVPSEQVGVSKRISATGEVSLNWFIDKYETEFLELLLGPTLSKAFIEGINAETRDAIWDALKNEIYTVGKAGSKLSPAANYVYFFIMRNSVSQASMVGDVKAKPTHSDKVSPAMKQTNAWNGIRQPVVRIRVWVKEHSVEITQAIGIADWLNDCWYGEFRPINEYAI